MGTHTFVVVVVILHVIDVVCRFVRLAFSSTPPAPSRSAYVFDLLVNACVLCWAVFILVSPSA